MYSKIFFEVHVQNLSISMFVSDIFFAVAIYLKSKQYRIFWLKPRTCTLIVWKIEINFHGKTNTSHHLPTVKKVKVFDTSDPMMILSYKLFSIWTEALKINVCICSIRHYMLVFVLNSKLACIVLLDFILDTCILSSLASILDTCFFSHFISIYHSKLTIGLRHMAWVYIWVITKYWNIHKI